MPRFKRSRSVKKWMNGEVGGRLRGRVRPRHRRCPVCKKIRMWWLPANMWYEGRIGPHNLGDQRMCWICVKRHPVIDVMDR